MNTTTGEALHMKAHDLLKIEGDIPDCIITAVDAYLEPFAVTPQNEQGEPLCLHCRKPVNGMMQMFGAAVAYQWGLAHGEARCSGCGWPARGMHYIKDADGSDLMTLRNVFLPYHPDYVSKREGAE